MEIKTRNVKKYVIFYTEPVGRHNETWHHIDEAEDLEKFKAKCREYGITDWQMKDAEYYELIEVTE